MRITMKISNYMIQTSINIEMISNAYVEHLRKVNDTEKKKKKIQLKKMSEDLTRCK